jgi:23S rRNA (cytosine1962-C5)-methyltransferase
MKEDFSIKNILVTEKIEDYELLDSGGSEKLEKYGEFVLRRPDLQAIWEKSLGEKEWEKNEAFFVRSGTAGKWKKTKTMGDVWNVSLNDLVFQLQLLPSKHLGVFPEQAVQWEWLQEKNIQRKSKS